jgi:hypothetical protein
VCVHTKRDSRTGVGQINSSALLTQFSRSWGKFGGNEANVKGNFLFLSVLTVLILIPYSLFLFYLGLWPGL